MCFDRGTQKKKLDNFLTFFQVCQLSTCSAQLFTQPIKYYIKCKEPLPMDVDFMLSDSLEVSHFHSVVATYFHLSIGCPA